MARTVKKEIHASKRNGILDTTLRLIYSKGYDCLNTQDIIDELGISKGTLYHYFDSKQAIVEALLLRMTSELQMATRHILEDPMLSATQKLRRYLDASVQWKGEHKNALLDLMQSWYHKKNDIIRWKYAAAASIAEAITPLIYQGVREGNFSTVVPEYTALMFAEISIGTSDIIVGLLLAREADVKSKVSALTEAYIDTIEQVFGLAHGSLRIVLPDINP